MFDIGFSEMMVIAVVALVVIGPEKLPRVARTVGAYLGRLQRYVNDVKADINREIELDELRKFKQQVEETAHGFESTVRDEISKTETEFNKVAQDLAGTSTMPGADATTPASPPLPAPAEAANSTASVAAEATTPHPSPAAVPLPEAAAAGSTSAPSSAAATADAGAKRAA